MLVEIFDVEHGACALITDDNGATMMIDCGHRNAPSWLPGSMLRGRGITSLDLLLITNYDEDHVSGIDNLLDLVDVTFIGRNTSVSPETIEHLKSEDGMGKGIRRLVRQLTHIHNVYGSLADVPHLEGVEWEVFSNPFPTFDDENNLSLVVWLKCRGVGIMFTGDMETEGFAPLLKNPHFVRRLQETHVFVAPHHGRISGCCDNVAAHLPHVYYVVISDKAHKHTTQETHDHYYQIANGGPFREEGTRYVLTTRNDGTIRISIDTSGSWSVG